MSECELETEKDTVVMFEKVKVKRKGIVSKLRCVKWWGRKRMRKRIKEALERAMEEDAGWPRGHHMALNLGFDQQNTV